MFLPSIRICPGSYSPDICMLGQFFRLSWLYGCVPLHNCFFCDVKATFPVCTLSPNNCYRWAKLFLCIFQYTKIICLKRTMEKSDMLFQIKIFLSSVFTKVSFYCWMDLVWRMVRRLLPRFLSLIFGHRAVFNSGIICWGRQYPPWICWFKPYVTK